MNSSKNKKRKRNLAKKAIAKAQLNFAMNKLIPKAIDNLPEYKLTEEQLEILKKRATN
jgi:hypothetical protein